MTSDGLRTFGYDEANRLAKVSLVKDGEAARVTYLHNALGQRVFKSEVQVEQTLPDEQELGLNFVQWLKKNFKWLFVQAQANTSVGTAYVYADGPLPSWALLGEYDNGSSVGAGRSEFIWLPTPDGAMPIGMLRNGKLFAIHADHLGTPRLMTNEQNQPVWQWPYSAFGNNKPTGILKATPKPRQAMTNQPEMLKATAPQQELNVRMPGQYHDAETGMSYNINRYYDSKTGRYTQFDPIGLAGGPNRYVYADQNPFAFIDPDGLQVAIPAPAFAPAAGSLFRPAAGTLVDPIVTPGAPDPNDPGNHQKCKSLKKRIDNLREEVYDKRYPDLAANPANLPQRLGPGEALRETVRGHEKLLNRRLRRLRELEDQYDKECLC